MLRASLPAVHTTGSVEDILVSETASASGLTDLVRRARGGDQQAFAEIYRARVAAISRYVGAIVRDVHRAEDAVAQTFLLAWRDLPRLRQAERFDAWLLRIAHNRAVSELGQRATVPLEDVPAPVAVDAASSPSEAAERQAESERLRSELLRLSPAHRDVLVLRFFHELSHAEVARVLGRRVEAVRALQYRALEQLRKRYTPED